MEGIEELKGKLSALLQKAEKLDPEHVPESRKTVSVWALEGSPVRMKNMISESLRADTIWDLVHLPYDSFLNSRARMSELVAAIDEALKMLSNSGAVGAK